MIIEEHRVHLIDEGFTNDEINALTTDYGVRSLTEAEALEVGFKCWDGEQWLAGSGLYFPFTESFGQIRLDEPLPRAKGKAAKYLTPVGRKSEPFIPDGCVAVTEGFKDALIATLRGVPTAAIAGVSHGRSTLEKGCGYDVVFDYDAWINPQVFTQLVKVARHTGGKVLIVPKVEGEEKAGLCELYRSGQTLDLKQAKTIRDLLWEWPEHWSDCEPKDISKLSAESAKLAVEFLSESDRSNFNRHVATLHKNSGIRALDLNRVSKAKLKKISAEEPSAYQADFNTVLARFGDRLKFNEVTKRFELDGQPFSADDVRPLMCIDHRLKLKTQKEGLIEIVLKIAKAQSYNPIQDYLNAVYERFKHDPDRLREVGSNLATQYLKSTESNADILFRKTLIGAIARAFNPGCKVDTCTVLVGPQGKGKSTAWEAIASPKYFCGDFSDIGNKDHVLKLHESWFAEWAELHGLSKREATQVKQFMSNPRDLIRVPYGRSNEWMYRQSIIVGTSNETDFLTDATGNRRWWVIECPSDIDVEAIKRDRDLIWAAAMSAYKSGEPWWADEVLERVLEDDRKKYQKYDIWHDPISDFLHKHKHDVVSIAEICDCVLELEQRNRSNQVNARIAKILRLEGFEKAPNALNHFYSINGSGHKSSRQKVWRKKDKNSPHLDRGVGVSGCQNPQKPEDEGLLPDTLPDTPKSEESVSTPHDTPLNTADTPPNRSGVSEETQTGKGFQHLRHPDTPNTPDSLEGEKKENNTHGNQPDLFDEVIDVDEI